MFRIARDAARLTAVERAHALRAVVWLMAARGALLCVRYPRARAALDRIPAARVRGPMTPGDAARAIRRAARVLPASSCLARALAAAALLRRNGIATTLTLEVALDASGALRAHAVLEADGVIVTGGDAPLEHLGAAAISRDRITAAP